MPGIVTEQLKGAIELEFHILNLIFRIIHPYVRRKKVVDCLIRALFPIKIKKLIKDLLRIMLTKRTKPAELQNNNNG